MNLLLLLTKTGTIINEHGVFVAGGTKVVDIRLGTYREVKAVAYPWGGNWYLEISVMLSKGGFGYMASAGEVFAYSSIQEATEAAYQIAVKFIQKNMETKEDEKIYNKLKNEKDAISRRGTES